jgi:predicted nucleic acid-binding protein
VISIDINTLLYTQNADCAEHDAAFVFLGGCAGRDDEVIGELVLVELDLLLRNPAVLKRPLGPKTVADICAAYRANPRWRLIEFAPVMDQVWRLAGQPGFTRRRIFYARIALTLLHHGVTDLATANVRDFAGFGFRTWKTETNSYAEMLPRHCVRSGTQERSSH